MLRSFVPPLLASAALLLASERTAGASLIYPGEIDDHLTLGYEPECTICHATPFGGIGTVEQPFGQKMISRGLTHSNPTALRNALDALDGEGSDVDGDGVGDIDELRAGTNPNPEGISDPPEYGCLGRIGPAGPSFPGALIAIAGIGWIRIRRVCASGRTARRT